MRFVNLILKFLKFFFKKPPIIKEKQEKLEEVKNPTVYPEKTTNKTKATHIIFFNSQLQSKLRKKRKIKQRIQKRSRIINRAV